MKLVSFKMAPTSVDTPFPVFWDFFFTSSVMHLGSLFEE